ncbi:NAD(P)-dependent oxidoreductase [Murimonas intestini]|uniref:NAD(P)-dependent oxidoreductase n=1 Tax=Murimonas intestini TaxID=1337051 RepID=UPI0011DDA5E5|nr:NAD(P)-dependent oxidoreductase [Murimonas intestini]
MNLLVTGAFAWTRDELNELKILGHEVIFMQQEKEKLPCSPEWVEGIIGNGIFLSHPIEKFTSLRYIQLTSAGFDRVPMDYVKAHNIQIHNARGVYSIPMAEFAICGVLNLYKQSLFFMKNQEEHQWEKHRGLMELSGKTVCIVGCGSVGTECAKRFKAFGCKVIGIDRVPYASEDFEGMYLLSDLEEKLKCSDVVVLTLPLTEKTYHIMNADKLETMKKGAVLVNIARGAVVDEEALVKVVKNRLAGVVLDVFEGEPLSRTNQLWNMENVIITPHNSFVGDGNHQRMLEVIFRNLEEQE